MLFMDQWGFKEYVSRTLWEGALAWKSRAETIYNERINTNMTPQHSIL